MMGKLANADGKSCVRLFTKDNKKYTSIYLSFEPRDRSIGISRNKIQNSTASFISFRVELLIPVINIDFH